MPLLPQREQGQKIHFCGTTLFAGFPGHLCNSANTPSALNAGITSADTRENSLSLCPRRPIYCPAFRSALSFAELSVDALRSFTSASMVCLCMWLFNYTFVRLSRTFFHLRRKRLPFPAERGKINEMTGADPPAMCTEKERLLWNMEQKRQSCF